MFRLFSLPRENRILDFSQGNENSVPTTELIMKPSRLGTDFDALTGIYLRQVFDEYLEVVLATASLERPQSMLYFDLDFFKQVNTKFGHHIGDRVITHIANLLPNEGDLLPCRHAGDEFTVLLPGLNETDSLDYANQLREIIANQSLLYEGQTIAVTASFGVSTTVSNISTEEFISQAHSAVYAAKSGGRNRAVHYRELEREALQGGGDVRIQIFEAMQRVVNERAAAFIALRRQKLFDSLQNQAERDGVTGLYNRGYLDRRIGRACQEASHASNPLCAALIDVDHFGSVNKTHGWPTGDAALRGIADLIRRNVRENDWVARYGGEEIAVILPGVSQDAAVQVIERIRQAVETHSFRNSQGETFSVTISAGVAEQRAGESHPALWQRLSDKLLEAKKSGRNRVCA
jgi:diguanylate cyclase (GGDEF)-like protein